jgi:23S rRNA (cytosine1962-C5)-methyltransferase
MHRNHPWIFSKAIGEVQGAPELGETVEVFASDGTWLGLGAYSPHSQIRIRVWTRKASVSVDADFFEDRIDAAVEMRKGLRIDRGSSAYREIFAESDGIPGLIIDRYNQVRVIQFLSAGVERWRNTILEILSTRGDCETIYERSDVDVRKLEGLRQKRGLLWGQEPEGLLSIEESGLRFYVDILEGHKTGFYLDQRQNRQTLQAIIPEGASVLDCFTYSGGFSLNAIKAGAAEVWAIDSSVKALELLEKNIVLNQLTGNRLTKVEADVFSELRNLRDRAMQFDVIVLDPPKFASTPSHVQRAARGYKDINVLAFKLLKPGGLLFTFSCSGGVNRELFQKIVADAALDAGRGASIVQWMGQAADHPIRLSFPEGSYLKGMVCKLEK